MENCAEIRGLRVSFNGETVLRGITADIPRHGVTVLLGRSGSGKTTLLRALNRLNESFAGYEGEGEVRLAIMGGMRPIYGRGTGSNADTAFRRHGLPKPESAAALFQKKYDAAA